MPGHDRVVVHPAAIAVQLEEVVEDPLDVVERVRPLLVAGELDPLPDLLVGRVVLQPLELPLQALELGREPRAAQQLDAAQLGEAVAQAELGVGRHGVPPEEAEQLREHRPQLGPRHDRGRCGRSGGSTRRGRSRPGASRASSGPRPAGRRTTSARPARRAARRRATRSSRAGRRSSGARAPRSSRRRRRAAPRARRSSSAAASAPGSPPACGRRPTTRPRRAAGRRRRRGRTHARTSRRRRSPSSRP